MAKQTNIVIPVILCGGVGQRLWPASTPQKPKPFIKIFNNETLLKKTYDRAKYISGCHMVNGLPYVVTVTNKLYKNLCLREAQISGVFTEMILEPSQKNTGVAISLAARLIKDKFGDTANIVIMPADHLIDNLLAFDECISKAMEWVGKSKFVTFGIQPTRPEIGYGYIKVEQQPATHAVEVSSFKEKPDVRTAELYIESGKYFWNSGIFCSNISTIFDMMSKYRPSIICNSLGLENCDNVSNAIHEPESTGFNALESISIDKAILEVADNVYMVQATFDWDDVGSWFAVKSQFENLKDKNLSIGDAIHLESDNVFTYSNGKCIASLGLKDAYIIEGEHYLLVADAKHIDRVKELANIVGIEAESEKIGFRPWGWYEVIDQGPGYKIKKIFVSPRSKLSLQSHKLRSEHWVVVSGRAKVTNGQSTQILGENESTFIPNGAVHRLENETDHVCQIIEVQCGSYLEEDDIVRYEDIYGREQ